MKVVILAGGKGTRISEYTNIIPKPMVPIGEFPIIWHIMKIYAHYGFKDFVIALGYKSEVIKDYFIKFNSLNSDFTVDLSNGKIEIHKNKSLDWKVTLVDTGEETMTGGRLKRLKKYLNDENHAEYELQNISLSDIESNVKRQIVPYNHKAKKDSVDRYKTTRLDKVNTNVLPQYLSNNLDKFDDWIAK